MTPRRPTRLTAWLTILVLANSAYLLAVDAAHLFYIGNILGHLALGAAAGIAWLACGTSGWRERITLAGTVLAITSGVVLVVVGNLHATRLVLYAHIGFSIVAAAGAVSWLVHRLPGARRPVGVVAGLSILAVLIVPRLPADPEDRITNPRLPPATMADEAMGGADGPFFPSAVSTPDGELIPSKFFLESQTCGRSGCHGDVTEQWSSSAHHFSSFNNQWYRKSIEYMQEIAGLDRPKWCAGCHDPALLFTGMMAQPVSEFADSPEALAGLGCVACHNIKTVRSTMGNADFELEYPPLHDLATSKNPILQRAHDFILKLDPAPHRETFLRPFLRDQPSEFCSSCHKVHLDEPVNSYRWIRGFNTYDNWQSSGVSGMGARSFYEPAVPKNCVTCHMPQVPSQDAAHKGGLIRAHNFPAANTALPTASQDTTQLAAVKGFLTANQIRLDLFAAGEPVEVSSQAPVVLPSRGQAATTFAVGMEQATVVGRGGLTREASQIRAPLQDGSKVLRRGREVRLDLVVRTLGLGHFFPSGTVDAQEAWIEFKAEDTSGRVLFWSGGLDEEGRVDPSAHFYRNFMVDGHGNHVNKRNANATRAVVYVNLIPPGSADVAHYRLFVPEDVSGDVVVTASLQYRKFTWDYTNFSFRGETSDSAAFSVDYDDRKWTLSDHVLDVAGGLDEVPDVPIVTMAQTRVTLGVADLAEELESPVSSDSDRGRWNDYGIGLLRQGDLKSAEQAFRRVTELDEGYADGWVNLARVFVAEGDLNGAAESLAEALEVRPEFHKALYFRGLYWKSLGEYDRAISDLQSVASRFPKDRVVRNQLGRVHYLDSDLERAIAEFEVVLTIDPEDLMAHYNLMLCYRALGNQERAAEHEIRYLRFKADESSQALARDYRARDPNVNNESLPIHSHADSGGR